MKSETFQLFDGFSSGHWGGGFISFFFDIEKKRKEKKGGKRK